MSREERWGTRDLAFSDWHRQIPCDDYTWIDIDHCAYCDDCKEPLYLFELAKDIGQSFKATTVTRKVAQRLGVPALLVLYSTDAINATPPKVEPITSFRIQRVAPTWTELTRVEPAVLIEWIEKTRNQHVCMPSLREAA